MHTMHPKVVDEKIKYGGGVLKKRIWNLSGSQMEYTQKQKKYKTISLSSSESPGKGHMTLVRSNMPKGVFNRSQKFWIGFFATC